MFHLSKFTCDNNRCPTHNGNQNSGVNRWWGCQLHGETKAHSYRYQQGLGEEEEAGV